MGVKGKVNEDLEMERKKCSFQGEEFTNWFYGGPQKVAERRWIAKELLDCPELKDKVPIYYLSLKEKYEATVRRLFVFREKIMKLAKNEKEGLELFRSCLNNISGAGITPAGNPLGLNFGMFIDGILGQGTDEQVKEWGDKVTNMEILGTYAQTELGHGTFVRGLETTATYDPTTEEFVINSPQLSSFKWWPGGLGHTANHCLLMAKLITQGKDRGMFPFMVQIRDLKTHQPMKGITLGDIGPKVGMDSVNNGFMGFKNVRIPRKNMMMRNAQVHKDGSFVAAPTNVLTYGTMVVTRALLIEGAAYWLSMACTIAIRYSAIRRQSQIDPSKPEVQILDHLTQQHKLFPQLAKSVVFKMVGNFVREMYYSVESELKKGQLLRLPELHALTCCLKAVTTTDAAQGIEVCRLACGGHGYLASSNMGSIYGTATAAQTYEGETTVLLLQTARYLIKAWGTALKGRKLAPTVAYLAKVHQSGGQNFKWTGSVEGIGEAFQISAGKMIKSAFENIEKRKISGMSHEMAVNGTSIELAKAAEIHSRAFLIGFAFLSLQNLFKNLPKELTVIFQEMVELYAVESALSHLGVLMNNIQISGKDVEDLQVRLEVVLQKIRPDAVGIVDSFDHPDTILSSTLGAYDGNAYERLFEEAMKSPLNQEPVNRSFELYLKPLMRGAKL